MTPFAQGWFVDKDFYGSASIKKVLPVLVSELSYKELTYKKVHQHNDYGWRQFLMVKMPITKEKIMNDLIEYCKLDTLAMVQLFKVLQAELKVIETHM